MDALTRSPGLDVEILVGPPAQALLDDAAFAAQWSRLADDCGHATYFQRPGFVRCWYDAYQRTYEPVVARSSAGVWLLARERASGALVHAGAHQAEYHAWLAEPGRDAEFVEEAWRALAHEVSFEMLRMRYLPHAGLLSALCAAPMVRTRLRSRAAQRPLALVERASIDASFAKKSNKSRFSRLRKLGALTFRRITQPDEIDAVLDALITLYDFRQGAAHGTSPFHEDADKRAFHARMFRADPHATHVTVTCLDGRVIAGMWGGVTRRTVHVGLLAYSPLFAEHSPGKLHLMQLQRLLLEEGLEAIDLTPGGDAWKERFADAHDDVADVELYRDVWRRRRVDAADTLRERVRHVAHSVGVRPAAVRTAIAMLGRARPSAVARRLASVLRSDREFRVYRMERAAVERAARADARVACNRLEDLLRFEPAERWESRTAFLGAALARLERGELTFTVCVGTALAHRGWMVQGQKRSFMSEVQQAIEFPDGSVALYDFYTHPRFRGQGLYAATIRHMMSVALQDSRMRFCYIAVLAHNAPSRHVIESLGFAYQGSLYWQRRLWTRRTWADPAFAAEQSGA